MTPEHLFVSNAPLTGCKLCGYAKGHHPSSKKAMEKLAKLLAESKLK